MLGFMIFSRAAAGLTRSGMHPGVSQGKRIEITAMMDGIVIVSRRN